MQWVIVTLVVVAVGVSYLLATLRDIGRVRDEHHHYRLSARFWLGLASFGTLMMMALAVPLLTHEVGGSDAGMLTGGLMALPPVVVIAAGLRNAWLLLAAARRRRRALAGGGLIEARVVTRSRWPLGQDLMALVVEAEVPDVEPSSDMAYRTRRPDRTVRHRFVEMCPGDHWSRFEPGASVSLRYDPKNLGNFAVLLFASA
ncbi:MAG: hypothetical protein AAF721_08405 [Myxococcota bacterium]